MRCKRHLTDVSSGVGVCATCLRERLLDVIASQTRLERVDAVAEDRQKHEQRPLIFPRSVSPYVNRRKSDDDGATWIRHQRFYSTPQVGNTTTTADFDDASAVVKKKHKFSLFSNLFGTRSEKFSSDPSVHNHRESCDEPSSSSSSSTSWLSAIFTAGRKNHQFSRTSRVEHFTQFGHRDRTSRVVNRGMSPAIEVNPEDECDRSPPRSSPGVSPRRKSTPTTTRASREKSGARNKSGMAFCLSPLVRASPNRQWNQSRALTPDMTQTSEGRPPMKPHLGSAARFCANRSKKIADFGRVNHNR